MCLRFSSCSVFFFFNDTATTEIYTLSLHDALPIFLPARRARLRRRFSGSTFDDPRRPHESLCFLSRSCGRVRRNRDRKSTRLNSSHSQISYAVFCLKKKKKNKN